MEDGKSTDIESTNKITLSKNKGGRPSTPELVDHWIGAIKCFRAMKSVETAADEMKVSVTTMKGYYRELAALKIHQTLKQFIEECKIAKASYLFFMDDLMGQLFVLRDELQVNLEKMFKNVSNGGEMDHELIKSYQNTLKILSKMAEQKVNVANSPTVDLTMIHFAKGLMDIAG